MRVDGAHLVAIADRDALDHVDDVGADGADGGEFLAHAEPLANSQVMLRLTRDLHVQVTEVADECTAWASHLDHALVQRVGHALRELHGVAEREKVRFIFSSRLT